MSEQQWCVPMYESERGWGSKIDGYAGPFDTKEEAEKFVTDYNTKYNSEPETPEWYMMALSPVPLAHHVCEYLPTVE